MTRHAFYCSEQSRQLAEKTYGTASTGEVWLLIEYPYSWEAKAFDGSILSPTVKLYLTRTIKSIPRARLLFIKQERPITSELKMFVVRCRERDPSIVRFRIKDYAQLSDINIASVIAGESPAGGEIFDEPLYLVCTHGRRDKCCAKFGYPVYKALRDYAGKSAWRSSHVGGDRFAANLVCFPHGLFYAHTTAETCKIIVDEYEQGRLVLEKYRGRACYSSPVQAAEFFVRAESGIADLDELHHLACERVNEDSWRARFVGSSEEKIYEATISRVMSAFQSYSTCQSIEEKSVAQYLLDDYRVTAAQSSAEPAQ